MSHGHDVFYLGEDEDIKKMLPAVLEDSNSRVRCFVEWQHCLGALLRDDCGLLIIDTTGRCDRGDSLFSQGATRYPARKTLAVVAHADVRGAVTAMKRGASDCIEKPVEEIHLLSVVKELLCPPAQEGRWLASNLTQAELLILKWVLAGKTTRQIAHGLHRSPRTIETHRRNVNRKLGVSNMVGLLQRAMDIGLVPAR